MKLNKLTIPFAAILSVFLIAAPAIAEDEAADDTLPFSEPKVSGDAYFVETFTSGMGSWIHASDEKYNGKLTVQEAKGTKDKGLYVDSPARHYGISALLPKPADPSEGIVLQYEARLQDGLECGGAYLKFVTADDSFKPEALNGDTPYTIMFGPDKCGATNKVHVIFRHKSPLDGSIEEKHLISPPGIVDDKKPHLYTLVLKPDNTYEVLVDSESKKSGSLFDDFEPPFNPPAEIDDPEDKKPEDWVDAAKIEDSTAVKPEDWDEDAPREIVDTEATKPEGWLDDEPDTVVDPDAKQPDDWDEEEDGTWEGPIIKNPKCEEAPGCGEWKPPMKANPDYKGKWYPPMIDNPDYKGPWAPRKIPNPKFYEDKTPLASVGKIGAVALEIWTMSSGLVVDNVLIVKDAKTADAFAEESWRGKFDYATKMAEKEAKDNAPKTPPFIVQKMYDMLEVDAVKPYADTLRPYVQYFESNPMVLYIFLVAVPALLLTLMVSAITGGKKTPMDVAAEAKKDDDKSGKDDEPEEKEEEKEEEKPEETTVKRRTRRAS